jgi:hypothetical protein
MNETQEIAYHEIEFTSWECNKANMNAVCAELKPVVKIQAVLDPETNIKTGLYFQHTAKLFSEKGPILMCIAENVFISPCIFSYSFLQMKELVETAHLRFKDKLIERAAAEEIYFTFCSEVNDADVEQMMQQQLKK